MSTKLVDDRCEGVGLEEVVGVQASHDVARATAEGSIEGVPNAGVGFGDDVAPRECERLEKFRGSISRRAILDDDLEVAVGLILE